MALTVVDALLVPVSDAGPASLRGWLTVGDDGRITGIGPGEPPAPSAAVSGEVLDAGGAIVAPGFVSAHSHLFTSGFRGIAPDATLYPWVRAMMEVLAHTDADDVYWATAHGACDFLANGVTSAYNFLQSRVVWLFDGSRNVAAAVNPPGYAVRQCAAAADAGLRVVRLGSGFADVVRLRRAGMRVGFGLDDQACTDISDPFANMSAGLYAMRALHHDAAVLRPADVLRMHTLGAAEVLGVADRVGSLEVGKYADLLVVDHRDPTTGPVWDVVATYVLACGLRNLKAVYVGGRPVAREGRCLGPLQARADAELHERIPRAAAAAGRPLPSAAGRPLLSAAGRPLPPAAGRRLPP